MASLFFLMIFIFQALRKESRGRWEFENLIKRKSLCGQSYMCIFWTRRVFDILQLMWSIVFDIYSGAAASGKAFFFFFLRQQE